jgi:nitrite reductase/ring-hydroxylating ferredoxin subunit
MEKEMEETGNSVSYGGEDAAIREKDRDLFRPGDRRCSFEGCKEDAALLCSDDGWIALCPQHGGEYEVLRARMAKAPTVKATGDFLAYHVAAMGGPARAQERMKGYALRKRLLGHA